MHVKPLALSLVHRALLIEGTVVGVDIIKNKVVSQGFLPQATAPGRPQHCPFHLPSSVTNVTATLGSS